MNSIQIREIVAWIRAHPDHIYESDGETFEDDTPAEAWYRFCRNPLLVNEYDDPEFGAMTGTRVPNGCTYIFGSGSCKSVRCNVAPLPGKKRCSFHDHLIFSAEVRDYLLDQHADINKDFGVSSQRPTKNTLQVIQIDVNLYYETERKLALRSDGTMIKCVGVFTKPIAYEQPQLCPEVMIGGTKMILPTPSDISPLTPELQTWCQQQGIVCN